MNHNEEFDKVIWWVLQEINKDGLVAPKGHEINFEISFENSLKLLAVDQQRALEFLNKRKIIKIHGKYDHYGLPIMPMSAMYNLKPVKYSLTIIEPIFDKTYKEFDKKYRKQISGLKTKEKKRKITYNDGILYFRDKEINFRNKQNQKELLVTIFKEPKNNWSYDEIQGKWDGMMKSHVIDRPKDYWKKFYSAGDDINKAVAIETQVKDFIIKNTKEIRINPKYI